MGIHDEVNHILADLAFEPESRRILLTKRIRTYLVDVLGNAWQKCSLLSHILPGGMQVYTASRLCMACNTIHVFVVTLAPSGEWEIAAPSPIPADEY